MVILATLVGAGFASGKEIFSFFFVYGKIGVIGIIISSFIISLVIYKVFKICSANNIQTYQEFCGTIGNFRLKSNSKLCQYFNSRLAELLNSIVNLLLLVTFYIMISGFSSLMRQEFGINELCGSMIIVFLCYITFQKNINGLIQISNYLVPVLILFIIYVATKDMCITQNYQNIFGTIDYAIIPGVPQYAGIIKSTLYACYNCIILIPILIPLKNTVKGNKNILKISVISFIAITILSLAIFNLLLQGNEDIYKLEMPIIAIVKKYGKFYLNFYITIIGISIFTSAVSTGYSFLNNLSKSTKCYKRNTILMCVTAIAVSQVSFSSMVNLLYPVLGIFGILEVILLFSGRF